MNGSAGKWYPTIHSSDLAEGEMTGIDLDGTLIALFKTRDQVFATSNICTHAFAILTDGWFEGEVVECPLHGGEFNVRNGKALGGIVECDLQTFDVQITDTLVEVFVPEK